ncbi:unnamed protein product [Ceutorhynchus assimilis]|uniref:Uncharacterized protein n=1 Tax=Ceutorhynchus assimilis TaxID=467358 RepID=A0A9N9MNA2_9CUCU|nr:unnamed protein product [Ceutorhynchus assimilis]
MPSATNKSFETMNELRPGQDDFQQLADLAGIYMDKELSRDLVQLLNMGISPEVVFNLLKVIRKKKTERSKSRRSTQRTSLSKHK